MLGFEQRLRQRAAAAGLRRGDRVVVGFSGGRDSLALAAGLARVCETLGIEPVLVHVDHGLRPSSPDEAARAVALASGLGLDIRVARLEPSPERLHPGVGLEEAARRERYRMLLSAATELGAAAVATAHHQRDQAETVLLHLLRGGGVHGAAAMSERAPWPFPSPASPHDISQEASGFWLWRPLLQEPRQAIDEYVATLGLQPIEDPSNEDVALLRNAVRHEVLPLLERVVPGATAALARYAALAAEDDAVLEEIAGRLLTMAAGPDGMPSGRAGEAEPLPPPAAARAMQASPLQAPIFRGPLQTPAPTELAVSVLHDQPIALQRRAIRHWLRQVTGLSELSANRTDAVLDLVAASRGNRAIGIGEGWTVRRQRGMLRATRGDHGQDMGGDG